MAIRSFDQKFGKAFLKTVPETPGVYLIHNQAGDLIYVGKAKHLRRRLSQYRNAKRRKKHYKMREIVRDAAKIEWQCCVDHLEACLLETRLIQERRPKWNVAGAFYFMYPMFGLKWESGTMHFCYTTEPDAFFRDTPGFELHGAFRSRDVCREAFFSLMKLLTFVGHANPRNRRNRVFAYSHSFSFRQLPEDWIDHWRAFFRGESRKALEELVLALIENAGARRKQRFIQDHLNTLGRFWRHEIVPLAKARKSVGFTAYPVAQRERDLLFLRHSIPKRDPIPFRN
jgi:excinuclease UvrABC nuclease subunit